MTSCKLTPHPLHLLAGLLRRQLFLRISNERSNVIVGQRTRQIHWLIAGCAIIMVCSALTAQQSPKPIRHPQDSLQHSQRSEAQLDSVVIFAAQDTNWYDVQSRTLYLIGNAWLQYKTQRLEAHRIILAFDSGTLIAEAADTGSSLAKFQDGTEVFYGRRIEYNFHTRKGRILIAQSDRTEGRYQGTIVKQVAPGTYFVQNGVFTTCDNSLPHYAFVAPKMRIDRNDKIFADPIFLTIEEFPVFGLPFGIFIDARRHRRSGFLIPSVFFSTAPGALNRGTVIENLGYYWAINDYLDSKFALRLTTKGGFTLFNTTRYAIRNRLSGSLNIAYGFTRPSPLQPYTTDWNFRWNHQHQLSRHSRLNIALQFSSAQFFQNVSTDLRQRVQQQLRSDASFYHQFRNGSSIALYYQRTQNLITGEISEFFPRLTFSLPQWYPLRTFHNLPHWLRNTALSYTLSGFRHLQSGQTTRLRIEHRPRLALRPRFRFFTFVPSIQYMENWYFRRTLRIPNGDSIQQQIEYGFFREYQYTVSLSASTRLYGIAYLQTLGIEAVRHILQPTVSWSYTPDFSDPALGMYGRYQDPRTGDTVVYSYFAADGGGVNTRRQQLLRLTIDNTFEAKVLRNDTTTTVIRLLTLRLGTTYNAAADSLRWSPLSASFRTAVSSIVSLYGSARFLLYDQVPRPENPSFYRTIDRLLITTGKGLARLTDANISISFNIGQSHQSQTIDTMDSFSPSRISAPPIYSLDSSFWGTAAPGMAMVRLSWELNTTIQFQYSAPIPSQINRSLHIAITGTLKLANSWQLRGGFSYNVTTTQINAPYVELRRDLHCWELFLRWYPIGLSQGLYLRIGLKAPSLRDIKLEKRTGTIYF